MSGISEILKGVGGTIELNRLSLFLGVLGYVGGTLVFQGYQVFNGGGFDVTAFCLAFGGGFAALIGGGAGAIAVKDRNVASSQVITATGSKPATPPAPAPEAKPEIAAASDAGVDERPSYAQ